MLIYKVGIDIGSTTAKVVVIDSLGKLVFDAYIRHQAKIRESLIQILSDMNEQLGNITISINITGSVGMGLSENLSLPFIQEVVATSNYIKQYYSHVSTTIDIGGEDAKILFFKNNQPSDLRMNGNCAGGTGAFIDQMAILLNVSTEELGLLAEKSTNIYPIASRCGVFCKTDIQNLIARNVPKEDIAASIFHAVSVQTVATLANGQDITTPILLCGGPLSFIPSLRNAFANYLNYTTESFILPDKAHLIPAWGAAISDTPTNLSISEFIQKLNCQSQKSGNSTTNVLDPIFKNQTEYNIWKQNKSKCFLKKGSLKAGDMEAFIGIDSGSTTTKIVVLDRDNNLIFSYYHDNNGNPIKTVEKGLRQLFDLCQENGTSLHIVGSCSTGYGEDLIKAAFKMNTSIVETMAHFIAAKQIDENVSFILDIGGQDMKAIFVENGSIKRIDVNEACSSGCGSFINTFARSLNCSIDEFATMASLAQSPCDLGTRCTVFMNSKVKQVLREGASIDNIAAGLSYSVVKNCLYKVLRLKETESLGNNIIVQGGTMRNDSIVKALENLTGATVSRCEMPELMGALGCALYAQKSVYSSHISLQEMLENAHFSSAQILCNGCENRCTVTRYHFGDKNNYFSGNRCEKIFNNKGENSTRGKNAYQFKQLLLFDRINTLKNPLLKIGIPRCLNMFEEFPFWNTLFEECNIQVILSDISTFSHYEQCSNKVMSDNICFPAKLVHSHIDNLQKKEVDRIFMPFVVFEKKDKQMQNSYNCPIVTGYSQVVQSVHHNGVPIDSPTISFKKESALHKQCIEYLMPFGINSHTIKRAVDKAMKAQASFEEKLIAHNLYLLKEARAKHSLVILLAGRPYHTDMLIQHKVSDMIANLGAYILTDDIVRHENIELDSVQYLSQWAFTNRILKAAKWASLQDTDVQFIQLTSFGCGPDAFLIDEIQSVLKQKNKNLTLLKIDDVNNIGSLKLRVRSLIESLNITTDKRDYITKYPDKLPPYTAEHKQKKIIVPFFTPFISPLIPPLMKLAGYDVDCLPMSDTESCDWGLKFSNNEVCYPATLIVGDLIKAFKSGKYDPDSTCVAITQTGGQCRASNYIALIKNALIENGYTNTPVISVAVGSGINNEQPAFKINWVKILPITLSTLLYSDAIAKLYHASVVREKNPGQASSLRDKYLSYAKEVIEQNSPNKLYDLLYLAVNDFNNICNHTQLPKVGIVGEIFLKFHPFAQKNVVEWLVNKKLEVIYPSLTEFFLQAFVNTKINKLTHVERNRIPDFLMNTFYKLVEKQINRANTICRRFRFFVPFDNIFEKSNLAKPIISLNAQFGEGWLIAGEIATFASHGITHVVSLQPFGCIANQIVEKGIENKIKRLYPQINILSLNFDSSVSDVNITNRLLLFINNIDNKEFSNE